MATTGLPSGKPLPIRGKHQTTKRNTYRSRKTFPTHIGRNSHLQMDTLYLHREETAAGAVRSHAQGKTLPAQGETPDGRRPFIRAGQTLLTRGKFPAKPEKRTSEAAPYTERPSFLSNAPRLCFTSLHVQRKASNTCRRSPRAWNRLSTDEQSGRGKEMFPPRGTDAH